MTTIKRIAVSIPDADMTDILSAVQVLQDKLLPNLITLTPQDRKELPKMGTKTVAFVQNAVQHAHDVPGLVPNFVNLADVDQDMKLLGNLETIYAPMQRLFSGIDDTLMAGRSNVYSSALAIYQTAKVAAKNRIQGAKDAVDDLGRRFPGHPHAVELSPPEPV